MRRQLVALAVIGIVVAACAASSVDFGDIPELPVTTPEEVSGLLADSERPVVLNVWASWCIPCRSEAPLFKRAAERFGDQVRFVGVNVRDSQSGARSFIAEFYRGVRIEHLFDRAGVVPISLGGSRGVPLTFFFRPGGSLVELHFGVIDERTLALQIDELVARVEA